MSTAEVKPAVTSEVPAVEPAPVAAAPLTTDKPAEAVEPKVDEPAKPEVEAAAPVEEKKDVKAEEEAKPVESGALGYKAPGLKNAFRFSKKYFWFSEEPVPVQSLSHYLRGEKADVAQPTAAWSSQTGKGLLYFVKHADEKATPAGVLNLSEATDLSKDGTVAFFFKLHGHKHTFEAQTLPERNSWFVTLEKAIEEAKAAKEGIVASDGYKEELTKLSKPATLAATAANSTPKKSTDATPKPVEAEAPATEAAAPARAGSASSSSSDEDKKKKKSKSKSRSVSRGKRASIFGGLLAKKDKVEEKAEEKKEESEAKKSAEAPAVATTTEPIAATAPVIPPTEELAKPAEEPKVEEPAPVVAAPVTEEKKVEEKPKPTKRGSIFGTFVEKLKSPTHEKKESEVIPAVPAKEPETATEAPKVEETPAAPVAPVEPVAEPEAPKAEEPKPAVISTTPHKEKQHFSFGKFLGSAKEKVRSPSGEKAPEVPKTEEPAPATETPAPVAPVEPTAEAPKAETPVEKKDEETPAVASTASATPTTKSKRGSIFGNLTGSGKKEGEEKPGLIGLFRNASKAGKSKKDKAVEPKEEKATEEPIKEEKADELAKEDKKEETPVAPATTEPATIGDVVPDAVTVGQAPKSAPQVSTAA